MRSHFQTSTAELDIARLKRGEAATQAVVFRQFEKAVYTLCLRMLGNATGALDAMQDSFIQAFGNIETFRGSAPFGMWLRSIVVHRCLRELRDIRRNRDLDEGRQIEQTETEQSWAEQSGASRMEQLGDAIDLEWALAQLNNRTRAVLWLHHVEGYQHSEIAELFGQSISFSKSQLARGLTQMRGLLTQPETHLSKAS